jgi:tetratricopeptide (TPR) repeat protein
LRHYKSPSFSTREGSTRYLVLLIGFAAFLTLIGPVSVSRAVTDDSDTCAHGSGDAAIAACTQATNSDDRRGSGLAWAYSNRGNRYREKGDNDRAIADLNQAIALDSKYAIAYYNRGLAWERKNDLQKALADFKKFSELDPADPDGPAAIARVTKVLGQ